MPALRILAMMHVGACRGSIDRTARDGTQSGGDRAVPARGSVGSELSNHGCLRRAIDRVYVGQLASCASCVVACNDL